MRTLGSFLLGGRLIIRTFGSGICGLAEFIRTFGLGLRGGQCLCELRLGVNLGAASPPGSDDGSSRFLLTRQWVLSGSSGAISPKARGSMLSNAAR